MKKYGLISTLLLIVAYNLVGFIATFQAIRSEWRQSVRVELAKMAESDLAQFVFAKEEFDISKKEFKQKGKYYDIVRIETKGDSLSVWCFDDATETRLTTEFHDLIVKKNTQNNDFQHKTALCFQLLIKDFYFPLENNWQYAPSLFLPLKVVFSYRNRFFLSLYLPMDTPPPDLEAALVA